MQLSEMLRHHPANVRFGSKADLSYARRDVRLVPIADVADATEESLIWNLSSSDKEASHSAAQSSSVVATLSLFFLRAAFAPNRLGGGALSMSHFA